MAPIGRSIVRWRAFDARHPAITEAFRFLAWVALAVVLGLSIGPVWLAAAAIVVLAAGTWWDYRPNGRGTRRLKANRTNPRRGFDWVPGWLVAGDDGRQE